MILGYNTNGLAHHDLTDAVELLADTGYRAVAVTLDHGVLNPFSHGLGSQIEKLNALAAEHGLRCVIETGARFLLDPRAKHEPTLVSPDADDRDRRIEFYRHAIEIARDLDAACVSIWSGVVHDRCGDEAAWRRLIEGLPVVLRYAARRGVTVAFEPEPGMFVDTLDAYRELKQRLGGVGDALRLTVDLGHLHCQGETPIADRLRAWAGEIVNVHVEDMKRGVHAHLMFGDGEIDFPPIIATLRDIRYDGPLCVELSRHSHDAVNAARRAHAFLSPMLHDG